MAYVKHGTGPNDYKKGNRTRGADRKNRKGNPNPDTTALQEANKARAERAAFYKKVAEEQAGRMKYGQEFAGTLRDNLIEYIEDTKRARKPLTIAGLIRAAGVSADTYHSMRNGNYDRILFEYMDRHGLPYDLEGQEFVFQDGENAGEKVFLVRMSQIVKNAELAIQEQLEENCYTNKGNPAGSIFGLKARYDWQDTPPDQRTTHNNTLVMNVANLDEAKEAMKRLEEG